MEVTALLPSIATVGDTREYGEGSGGNNQVYFSGTKRDGEKEIISVWKERYIRHKSIIIFTATYESSSQ